MSGNNTGWFCGGIGQFLLNQGASLLMFSHVVVDRDKRTR